MRPRSLLLVVAAACLSVVTTQHAAQAELRDDRPRLYLTPSRLAALQAAGKSGDMADLAAWIDKRIANPSSTNTMLESTEPGVVCHNAALVAVVTGESKYVAAAKEFALHVGATPNAPGDDTGPRNRALCLAIAYDWLHASFSPTELDALRKAIVADVAVTASYVTKPDFVAGHSRWGNATTLAAALALRGDTGALDASLAKTVANFTAGYNLVLDDVAANGGHPMGWQYGAAYSSVTPMLVFQSATTNGELWSPNALHDAAYFWIYAMNGAGEFPLSGDVYTEALNGDARDLVAMSASLGNAHAEAFYAALPKAWEPQRFARILTNSGALASSPIEALPLSRHFAGSGFFVARDSWDRASATTSVFKSSPFYSYGHHHRDEGSLVIDYKGGLLTEGGTYDNYGTTHHASYYTRSVAHNTLLVHWPEEVIREGAANDGGQRIAPDWSGEPTTQADLHGIAKLAGMGTASDAGACVHARTDLAPAYAKEKLSAYTRDMVELRKPSGSPHPAFFVLDRATLPVARESAVLWHFVANAAASSTTITAENPGGGAITLDVVRPAAASIVGFSAADRYRVGDAIFAPDPNGANPRTTPYWGRFEVRPAAPSLTPTWSTLLRVSDVGAPKDERHPVDLGGADWAGVRLGDTIAAVAWSPITELVLPAGSPLVDGCIAGVAPSAVIAIAVGDAEPIHLMSSPEGLVVVDPLKDLGPDAGTAGSSSGLSGAGGMSGAGGSGAATTGAGGNGDVGGGAPGSGSGATASSSSGCACAVGVDPHGSSAGVVFGAGLVVAAGLRSRARRARVSIA